MGYQSEPGQPMLLLHSHIVAAPLLASCTSLGPTLRQKGVQRPLGVLLLLLLQVLQQQLLQLQVLLHLLLL